MPLHDWTRVPAGLYHDLRQSWTIRIKDALNAGILPAGVSALVEQRTGAREADVLAIEHQLAPRDAGLTTATLAPPATRIVRRSPERGYADRANRIAIRHHLGRVIAAIEIVSPGNKDRLAAVRDFVAKALELLDEGIHLLIVDPFPPTPSNPDGLHKAIWDAVEVEPFQFPLGKDRLLVAYEAGATRTAYIEPLAVGDVMPDMPLFLAPGWHVLVPLEATYRATWEASPAALRRAVETGGRAPA